MLSKALAEASNMCLKGKEGYLMQKMRKVLPHTHRADSKRVLQPCTLFVKVFFSTQRPCLKLGDIFLSFFTRLIDILHENSTTFFFFIQAHEQCLSSF